MTLHYTTQHNITLHCIALHYIRIHYITLRTYINPTVGVMEVLARPRNHRSLLQPVSRWPVASPRASWILRICLGPRGRWRVAIFEASNGGFLVTFRMILGWLLDDFQRNQTFLTLSRLELQLVIAVWRTFLRATKVLKPISHQMKSERVFRPKFPSAS
jgi:hypothetical protein